MMSRRMLLGLALAPAVASAGRLIAYF